ncbi:MAG TPA: multicopper oxidase domain-containing protein [Flavobacteriales bacterium]|nr:multicopper oxidase domain-containing protein [Flavobacteriales bacterium]
MRSALPFLVILLFVRSLHSGAQTMLPIPPMLLGSTIDLQLQEGTWEFHPGEIVDTYGYNGDLLGPTILLEQGQQVTLNVTNTLPDLTTTHWHGLHVAPEHDGGPHSMIMPGTTWSPSFTVLDKAATYWYHPHAHGLTDYQVTKGAAGMIIVRDAEEGALDLPRTYGVDDIPLILQTKPIMDGQIMLHTGLDTVVVTNGVRQAEITLPAQVVRLRCLNGSNERTFLLGFSNGMTFNTIATDGGLLAAPIPLTRQFLTNGERVEVLIDLSGMEGQVFDLISFGSELPNGVMGSADVSLMGVTPDAYYENDLNGADFRLLRITVGSPTTDPVIDIPSTLANLVPYQEVDATVTRDFVFAPEVMSPVGMVEGPMTINDALFDMDVINETITLGTTEIWTFTNNTAVGHPFHIHDIQFHVLDRDGLPVPSQEQGRKDVVFVPPNSTVRVITRFDDFADPEMPYMYHCHILMHEDEGMMGQFLVVDPNAVAEPAGLNNALTVWPNPSTAGIILLRATETEGLAEVIVIDATGRTAARSLLNLTQEGTSMDLSALESGLYALQLHTRHGQTRSYHARINLQH